MDRVDSIDEHAKPSEQPPSAEEESLGELLAYYWNLLRRYYWVLLIACIVTVGGAYFWTKQQPEIYQASSSVVFHRSSGNILGAQSAEVEMLNPGNRWEFEQFWNTQKQVFQSRWFAERVVERVGLVNHPDFLDDPPDGESRSRKEKMEAAIAKVQGISDVHLKRESRVGIIDVRSKNPELASKIANGMAEAYVDYTKEFKSGGRKEISNWFDSYVKNQRQELEAAQKELEKFKQKNNILSFSYEDRQNLTADSMEKVNNQLLQVRNELSAKEALLEQLQKLQQGDANSKAIADLVDNKNLTTLFEREAELEEKLAKLESQYLPKHPKVQAVTSQLESLRKNIQSEIDRVKTAAANEVAVLRRNKESLTTQLDNLKQKIFRLNELGVDYRQKKDRVENLKELYDTVLKRSSELNISSLSQPKKIKVLETAHTPENPVSPNLPVNLVIGLFAGLALGASGIVVLDTLDTTIKSKDDITQLTEKPVLAMLPELREDVLGSVESIGESPADTITHTAPKSSFAEGIKTLRTNLTFMAPDNPPKSLLVTSPGPGEGKTLSTTNTGIAMAQSGADTLLVDTDLRKPRLHAALGVEKQGGVTEILRGDREPSEVVKPTDIDNLEVLTSGDIPPNPSEMLHSERFETLTQQLRSNYDRVLFDSPPLGVVSDSLILSQLVDGVLLIVQFGKTRMETLNESLEQLHGVGAPLLGTVINEISASGNGYYSYSYSYYRDSSYRYGREADGEEEKRFAG